MKEFYGAQFLSSKLSFRGKLVNHHSTPTPNTNDAHATPTTAQVQLTTINTRLSSTLSRSNTTSWIISSDKGRNNTVRKLLIVVIALCFGIYGIVLISLVFSHFDESISYCSSIVDELNNLEMQYANSTVNTSGLLLTEEKQNILDLHPELFLYDYCEFKVYPFGDDQAGNKKCDCRQFSSDNVNNYILDVWPVPDLLESFDIRLVDMLSGMLLNWKMLEKFEWSHYKRLYNNIEIDAPRFNFTHEMFGAIKMRVFILSSTPIIYIDESISNWKLLSILRLTDDDLVTLPQSIGNLPELGYVDISETETLSNFPIPFCNLKNLKGLEMEVSSIESVPECIVNLPKLESLVLSGSFGFFDSLPIAIFNKPSLTEISCILSDLSISSLLRTNNFSSFAGFDAAFNYDLDKRYYFEGSPFCDEYDKGLIPSNSTFYKWINESDCCETFCEATGALLDALYCPSYTWADGVCDKDCDIPKCGFDGGDCTQNCDCDIRQ